MATPNRCFCGAVLLGNSLPCRYCSDGRTLRAHNRHGQHNPSLPRLTLETLSDSQNSCLPLTPPALLRYNLDSSQQLRTRRLSRSEPVGSDRSVEVSPQSRMHGTSDDRVKGHQEQLFRQALADHMRRLMRQEQLRLQQQRPVLPPSWGTSPEDNPISWISRSYINAMFNERRGSSQQATHITMTPQQSAQRVPTDVAFRPAQVPDLRRPVVVCQAGQQVATIAETVHSAERPANPLTADPAPESNTTVASQRAACQVEDEDAKSESQLSSEDEWVVLDTTDEGRK